MIKKLYTNNKTTILQASIIFILTMAVYANSIHNEFTNWDDTGLIVNNTSIRSLDFKNIISILTPHKGSTFQPIRVLSYAIDYHISKLNPVTFHIHNMILHGFAAIFLYLLLIEILPLIGVANFKNKKSNIKNETLSDKNNKIDFYRNAAFLTALLFAIHPINVEAVTWMSGRKYTLLTFWGFAAFLLFVKSSKNDTFHPIKYTLSFIFTIISILSSPFGIAFPVLFFLFDYCRDDKLNPFLVFKKRFIYFAPYLALSIFFLTLFSQTIIRLGGAQGGSGGAMTNRHTEGILPFAYTTFRVVFDYLRNLITPFWLASRYADLTSNAIFQIKVIVSILIIITATITTVIRTIKGKRLLLFCFGWTFITWLPSSNIIPISTLMADRYFYLPAPGLFILFSVTIVTLFSKIRNYNQRKFAFIIFLIILLGYLIPFTLQANRIWKNSETLWRNCLEQYPTYLSCLGLSATLVADPDTYKNKQKLNEATALLTDATREEPNLQDAFINMGTLFSKKNDYVLGIVYYKRALDISSDKEAIIKRDLANLFAQNGNNKEAAELYYELLQKQPNNEIYLNNFKAVYSYMEKVSEDKKYYNPIFKKAPKNIEALEKLGKNHYDKGEFNKAKKYYTDILKLDPENAFSYFNLGLTAEHLKNYNNAILYYSKAIALEPLYIDAIYNKAVILEKIGDTKKAVKQYLDLLEKTPDYLAGHNNLGAIFFKQGDISQAIFHFKQFVKAKPTSVTGHCNLGVCYLKQKNIYDARDHFRATLILDPDNNTAKKGINALRKILNENN